MTRILILCLIGFYAPVWGQDSAATSHSGPPKVGTNWTGVEMQVYKIERIPGNRLLVTICLITNEKAPPSTLIGIPPPNAPIGDQQMAYTPAPFSLDGSTMIEEQTQQKYNMLAPDPKGPIYASSSVMGSLSPGQCLYLAVQFPLPPPPLPDENGQIPKQKVSLFLPNTKGPIVHVVVPPPAASTPAVGH